MHPAALYKIPTQTVDSSQVFKILVLQKQPKVVNKLTKSWDKKTMRYLEQAFPKQDHDFLS